MFTTGSKLFIGASTLSVIASVVWARSTEGPAGFTGTVGLVTTAVVFAFLAGLNLYNRDGTAPPMQQGIQYTSAAAQPPAGRSMWPAVAALGAAGLAVGAVSKPVVFKVSVVVVLAAVAEWMIQGWSERASGDAAYNAGVRGRLLHPLEFPILAAAGLGAVIYSFSRIMLGGSHDLGRIVFIVLAALILGGAFVLAYRRGVGKATVAGITGLAALALVGVGVASAVKGQRTIEPHGGLTPAVCNETATAAEMEEADHKADTGVSLRSAAIANVVLQSNGTVIAWVTGYPNDPKSEISVPRNAHVSVLFHNELDRAHRLTAHLGTFGTAEEVVTCTAKVAKGDEQFLSLVIPKTSAASSTALDLTIPDLPGQTIKLVVP